MVASFIRSCADPEQYQRAFVGASVEVLPTRGGLFSARATRVAFDRLWIAAGEESAPCIKHLSQAPTRAFITFLAQPGPDVTVDGVAMPVAGLMRHSLAHTYHERSTGSASRGSISLPIEDMTAVGIALAGRDLAPPRDTMRVIPSTSAIADLLRRHAEAIALAGAEPITVAHPEVARSLEQSLIEATVKCLADATPWKETWAQRCHETVMRRFRRVLDENPDRALYLPEICAAIGVPDRTLRLCCSEHLGMGPKSYLLLRRMHLAQRALQRAAPGSTTVTEIATQYGFWHFGRFASAYKSIFGELPSGTLGNTPT